MTSTMLANVAAVRSGAIAIEELARRRIVALDDENPRVNAVVEHHPEEILRQARALDAQVARGTAGTLAGAILTVKDNLNVRGMRSTAGIAALAHNVADADCAVVARLRAEGALILGKTNMPPGAMDVQTDNPVYGRTNHPLFADHTCGGSSGGGACAVRLGLSDMDIGNDLLGSIRIPSHFCGIYGYVPTERMVDLDGIAGGRAPGSTMTSMLRVGLQAAAIEDIRYVLPLIAREDGQIGDAHPGARLRIAWSDSCGGLPLADESKQLFAALRARLAPQHELFELGAEDYDFAAARECFLRLLYGAIASTLPPAACFFLHTALRQKYMSNSLKGFLAAENAREACIRQLDALFARCDCLVTPVSATPAFPHLRPERMQGIQPIYGAFPVDGVATNYATANLGYTTPFHTGHPVVSMPIGVTREGLPVGVQVIGPRGKDARLLDIVGALTECGRPVMHGE